MAARTLIVTLSITLFSGSALGAKPGIFTGFWKTRCENAFGLQIIPFGEEGKYSVSFCGPGGCFEPGTYRPLTKIENDSAYEVISPDHIKVLGRRGKTDYYKCTKDMNPTLRYKSSPNSLKKNHPAQKT